MEVCVNSNDSDGNCETAESIFLQNGKKKKQDVRFHGDQQTVIFLKGHWASRGACNDWLIQMQQTHTEQLKETMAQILMAAGLRKGRTGKVCG